MQTLGNMLCYILGIIRYLIGTLTPKVRGPGICYHLVGIRRYLLGRLTSNLRSDLRGGGGGVGGSEKVKRRISIKFPPPS